MAITVDEMYRRKTGDDIAERGYLVRGTEDETVARDQALASAPAVVDGKGTRTAQADEVESEAGGAFIATVAWRKSQKQEEELEDGDQSFSFSVRAAPQLIRQAKQVIASYPGTALWTDRFGGAINVDSDGTVQGVQWPPAGTQVWSVRESYLPSRVTTSYFRSLAVKAGGMNSGTFQGFAAHELLFLGANGSRKGLGNWEIDFDFAVSANDTRDWKLFASVAGQNYSIVKDGWDYLWFHYQPTEHQDGGTAVAIVKKPVAAYVVRVADEFDFNTLAP